MSLNFPASPSNGDQYTSAGIIYTWDGEKWVTGGFSPTYVKTTGDTMTGKLATPSTISSDSGTTAVTKDYVDGGDSPSSASAYVNFDGTTLAIRQQLNVAAVTSLGTGQWKMTYTSALQNASYCLAGYGGINSPQTDGNLVTVGYKGPLTSEQMLTATDATFSTGWVSGATLVNPEICTVIVFAN